MAATLKILLNLKQQNADGTYPLICRIGKYRKKNEINVGIDVYEYQWHEGAPTGIIVDHQDARRLNTKLAQKWAFFTTTTEDAEKKNLHITSLAIKKLMEIEGNNECYFFVTKEWIDILRENKQDGRADNFEHTMSMLRQYTNRKAETAELLFSEIDHKFLELFNAWLGKRINNKGEPLSQTTINDHFRKIRSVFKRAHFLNYCDPKIYPFNTFKIAKDPKSRKTKLKKQELKGINAVETKKEGRGRTLSKWYAQGTFDLQFSIKGGRISDVLQFKVKNFAVDKKTDTWHVAYYMGKNQKFVISVLNDRIKEFVKECIAKCSSPDDYIIPFYGQQKLSLPENKRMKNAVRIVNSHLKTLAKVAGVEKHVTTHVSRHSFASIADREIKGDTRKVQSYLAHSDLKTTEGYLEDLRDEDSDDEIKSITSF